jgi:hypothetical protein
MLSSPSKEPWILRLPNEIFRFIADYFLDEKLHGIAKLFFPFEASAGNRSKRRHSIAENLKSQLLARPNYARNNNRV